MKSYHYDHAISGFFYADATIAARLLPPALRLLEPHPGQAVVNVTMFNFSDSVVGPYAEMVIALAVVPWASPGEALPHGAFFPLVLASTTEISRTHATTEWKLPDFGRCVTMTFGRDGRQCVGRVEDQGQLLVELRVELQAAKHIPAQRFFQSFVVDQSVSMDSVVYRASVAFAAPLYESEEETARVVFGHHPAVAVLHDLIDEPTSCREMTMMQGEERYGDLVLHVPTRCMV